MTNKRVCEILKNKDIKEIYYNDQPVWIQEVHGNKATVGFVGSNDTKDLYIKVPLGTVVKDSKTGKIIADLTENEQTVLVAKGGRGGRGNARFATAQKRAPQFCEPGEPGIERVLELELKLIADIGLLGMPNAGKSTFISAVSSASSFRIVALLHPRPEMLAMALLPTGSAVLMYSSTSAPSIFFFLSLILI